LTGPDRLRIQPLQRGTQPTRLSDIRENAEDHEARPAASRQLHALGARRRRSSCWCRANQAAARHFPRRAAPRHPLVRISGYSEWAGTPFSGGRRTEAFGRPRGRGKHASAEPESSSPAAAAAASTSAAASACRKECITASPSTTEAAAATGGGWKRPFATTNAAAAAETANAAAAAAETTNAATAAAKATVKAADEATASAATKTNATATKRNAAATKGTGADRAAT